jgi:hypothetical protein
LCYIGIQLLISMRSGSFANIKKSKTSAFHSSDFIVLIFQSFLSESQNYNLIKMFLIQILFVYQSCIIADSDPYNCFQYCVLSKVFFLLLFEATFTSKKVTKQ